MAKILFGGSFDPLHNGHLRIAREASRLLDAPLIFIPSKSPRWKVTEETEEDRLKMLEAALKEEGNPRFSVDTIELERAPGTSYTIDTIREYKRRYPDEELYFLIGADQVNRFADWKDAEELASLAQVLYSSRPGTRLDQEMIRHFHMRSIYFERSGAVSSSEIRILHSLDLPRSVLDYIETHRLYFVRKIEERIGKKRTDHSLSVGHLAERIILSNGLPFKGKGYIAGAIHDLGKYLSLEEGEALLKKAHSPLDPHKILPYALHQYTGAILAGEIFDIEDPLVLDAVSCHCTGKERMSSLAKILYSSDKIEPTRGYDSSAMIDLCLKDYKVGFLKVLRENRDFLRSQGLKPEEDPLSEACFRYYLKDE